MAAAYYAGRVCQRYLLCDDIGLILALPNTTVKAFLHMFMLANSECNYKIPVYFNHAIHI